MRKPFTAILFGLLFTVISNFGFSQTYNELVKNTIAGKDITLRLPSISSLQVAASENSPLLKIHSSDVVINELKVKSLKRDWMNSLGFEAGVKYGLFDNLILKSDLGLDEINTNTTEQTRYNMGVFLKIPLSTIADKSNVQIAEAELDRLKFERESILSELRQLIIVQYNNVVKSYRSMIVQNNSVENYRLQMMNAEKEFENGEISIADYARLNDMLSRAVMNFENIKVEYLTALLLLEETVGVEIKLED